MIKWLALVTAMMAFTLSGRAAWAQPTTGSPPDRLMFVLDVSGSMWGKIGSEPKIVITRRVLKDLLNQLADDTHVGLVVYGHRRERDCQDIEIVKPMSALDREAMAKQIDGLNPRGKTPITGALETALGSIAARRGSATIVLLSDGLETCGGDPCQTVIQAKATGADVVMHIIGFDVSDEDVSQLECAAQAGGGLYLSAENADELAAALTRAVAPVDSSYAVFSIKAVANGQLIDARVGVFRTGTHDEVASGRTYTASSTNPRLLPVMAGDHDIEVHALGFKGESTQRFTGVKVAPGDTLENVVDFSAGELAVKVTRNRTLSNATINVYAAGTRNAVASGRSYTNAQSNPKVFKLTPGSYDVVIRSVEIAGKPEERLESVVVEPGRRSEQAHNFESGTLRIGVVQGAEPVDAVVSVMDASSRERIAQGRTYTSPKSNPRSFELPPGQYHVTIRPVKLRGSQERSLDVVVIAGEVAERTVAYAR